MTTIPFRLIWLRIFRRAPIDPVCFKEGWDAFAAGQHDNPYPEGTNERRSWQRGYDRNDDWAYVW